MKSEEHTDEIEMVVSLYVLLTAFSMMILLQLNEAAPSADWATQAPVWQLALTAAGIGLIFPALFWVTGGDR